MAPGQKAPEHFSMPIFKRKTPPPDDPGAGSRYQRLGALGEGGIAKVSGHFDTRLNRVVALKELKDESCANPDLVRSFITEMQLISFLDHPGVVPVYDSFAGDNEKLCYTMKLFEGDRLTKIIELMQKTPADTSGRVARCIEVFAKIGETLAYAHMRGVLHLDLKPDNILIGRFGEVAIMDWGSACLYDQTPYRNYLVKFGVVADNVSLGAERAGIVLGTPRYMSPEQINRPRTELLPSSDIFSAGIVLYEMIAGRHPFPATELREVLDQVRSFMPPPLHEKNPDVPRRLSQICSRMIEKDRTVRYQTFQEVLTDLAALRNSGQAFATRTFEPGAVICREGETGDFAFIILSGSVSITKRVDNKETELAVLGRDAIVGELAVFTNQTRTATATSREPTTIRILRQEDVQSELDKLSPWVEQMIAALSRRFIDVNDKYAGLLGRR
jgi:eukaryotic-like serine/threonine-protein kinase